MDEHTKSGAGPPIAGDNIAYSYGTLYAVRTVLGHLGLTSYLDNLKDKGVPLGTVVESLCIMHLQGISSMNRWADRCRVSDVIARDVTGSRSISRKTYERCLERLDEYFEDIIGRVNDVLWTMYPDLDTDVYVDGSHIPRAGGAGENVKYGEGGGTMQLQDQFMVAQLVQSSIPVMVELYPGNENDPQQYSDFIPQLMFLLKRGSTIIMDNGGDSAPILNAIKDYGDEYITRGKLNSSDSAIIKERIAEAVYVGHGAACITTVFKDSGRANYLFFSVDTLLAELYAAERAAVKLKAEAETARRAVKGHSIKDLVKMGKNRFAKVKITRFQIGITLDPWTDLDYEAEAEKEVMDKGGWFKITSSRFLEPAEILYIYRHRVAVEHLIRSLKSAVNLKPLHVFVKSHERGSLIVGMLAQLVISIIRYEMAPDRREIMDDGRVVTKDVKPSFETICSDLSNWIMAVEFDDGCERRHICNQHGCVPEVKAVLEDLENRGPVVIPTGFHVHTPPRRTWDV